MKALNFRTASLELEKAEWLFLAIMLFLFGSGLVAHAVPSLYPFTLYTTDIFLVSINGVLLYFVFQKNKDQRLLYWAVLTYIGTFILEALGVATGKIFGVYHYGDTMLVQFLAVPLVIALNWTVLILGVNNLLLKLKWPSWVLAILSGVLIAFYDYFIEPVAIRLDYWQWADDVIPLQNYIAWAVIAFVFSWPLHHWKLRFTNPLLTAYLVVQFIYFILLNQLM